jgi:hypothetical protein
MKIEHRAKWYANFAGILIGFSITIAVLIVTLCDNNIPNLPQYGYSLAAFVYSALAFFSTYTWYGRAVEYGQENQSEKQDKAFQKASLFYYTGYWSILLGLIYLTSLIQLEAVNFAFFIPFVFLVYTFWRNLRESLWEIFKGNRSNGILLLVLLIVFIVISVFTIPLEPFLAIQSIIRNFFAAFPVS